MPESERGLDRVLSRKSAEFNGVGLGVLAANVHRIGLVLQRRERARLRRAASGSRARALPRAA